MERLFIKMTLISAGCFGLAAHCTIYNSLKMLVGGLVVGGVAFALFAIREMLLEVAERIRD